MMLNAMMSHLGPNCLWQRAPSPSNFHTRYLHHTRALKRKHVTPSHYYDVLGITPKATHKQIKSAFYKLSKTYHPDSNPDVSCSEKFHEIAEAYEILGNNFTRKKYDRGLLNPTDPRSDHRASDEPAETTFRPGHFKGRGPIATGRTKHYDFDEYYRQHYGEHVLHQFKRRHRTTNRTQSKERERLNGNPTLDDIPLEMRHSVTHHTSVYLVIVLLLALYVASSNSGIIKELERSPVTKDSKLDNTQD